MSTRAPSEPPTVVDRPGSGDDSAPTVVESPTDGGVSHSPATAIERPAARGRPTRPPVTPTPLPTVPRETYEVLDEYARGGLGRIVRARDVRTGRTIAIKEMLSTDNDEIERRFVREARVTANLQHPAVVPVYEIGKWPSGEPFYAMKLVAGKSLAQVIEHAKDLDERLARLPVVATVADALAYAHGQRVIHRDLKPANVIVGEFGESIVIDWGLAKLLDDDDQPDGVRPAVVTLPTDDRTLVGTVLGTPYYMPPEQASGQTVDERADVYAIGAMLYHLITGHAPYTDRPADQRDALIAAHAVTPILAREPEAPPDLVSIAQTAMDPDPAKRYPSARELADELRRFTSGQLVRAHRYDRWTLIARWLRRNKAAVIVASVLVVAGVIGGIASVSRILEERDAANRERTAAVVARREADHQASRAREGLSTALYQKGRDAEQDQRWPLATMYYAAARVQHDTPEARWAAGLAEARAIVPHARHIGHDAVITDGVFAPDDKTAITVDEAGTLRVWSVADGSHIRHREFPVPLRAVAAHGEEIAIGDTHGTITRLRATDLSTIGELRGHAGVVLALAYSPDGETLASGGQDKTARTWTLATGAARAFKAHTQAVMSVAFSRDGKELATGSDDRTVRMWNLATGTSVEKNHHVSGGVNAVVVGRSSDVLISSGWDFAISIWPATSWYDSHSIHALALTNDDRVLATAGDFGEVHLWDISTQKLVARLDFTKRATTLAFSRDGRWLLAAGQNKTPIVWDVRSLPRHVDGVGHRANVVGVAFTEDSAKFATSSDDNTIRLWDTASGSELARVATASPCVNPVILRSGELAASCDDKTLRKWSLDGRETGRLATDVWLRFSALSPDGKTLAAGHMRGRLGIVDVATWTLVKELTAHGHQIYTIDYATTGELVTGSLDGHVKVWASPSLDVVRDVTSKGTGVFGALIDPKHQYIVAVSQDGGFEAWDFASGTPLTRSIVHEAAVWKLVYARDGSAIYTASEDGTAKIFEPGTWRVVRSLDPGEGALDALGLAPDGKTLVAGSRAGGIVIYDTQTWTPRRRVGGHARDHGSCDDLTAQAWADDTHRAIVLAACKSDAAAFLARYGTLSHQKLRGDVDVVTDW